MTSKQKKGMLLSGLLSGFVFAVIMAVIDYFSGDELATWKFIFHLFFFGTAMAILNRYNIKKGEKQS